MYYRLIRKGKLKYKGTLLYSFKADVLKTRRVLKSIMGKMSGKTKVPACLGVKNTKVTVPKCVSEDLCPYFTNVECDLSSQIPDPNKSYTFYLKQRNPNSILLRLNDLFEI